MKDRDFQNLMRRSSSVSNEVRQIAQKLAVEFERRYGTNYDDLAEADELVDALNYGAGSAPTCADVDRIMAAAGYPRKEK